MIKTIFGWLGRVTRSGTTNPAQWLVDWVRGGEASSSGVNVSEQSALKYTPFWSAVRVISGTLAALPFIVYRRVDGGKERVIDNSVYQLIHNRPNEYMDALTFFETRQAHVLTYGNGYAEIQRNGAGKPIALWPLLPDRTSRRISDGGIPYYEVRDTHGDTFQLPDYNVLHIKGLGFDGYSGYNVVDYQKAAIGYGMAVKRYGSAFFGNGANPGGILETPETLSKEAAERLRDSWNSSAAGLSKAHRTQVLEEGLKWTQTGVDPAQAQALETQKYNVDDCARIFNIPPHKIASLDRATFSNIEEQNIDFVSQTMYYWFRKWEQECNYKLFSPVERKTLFCEILVDGLLRGDTKSRYESYNIGRNAGFLSVNDIREKENMNSIGEEGDTYLEPLNMKPAGTEDPAPEPPPEPEPDDDSRAAHKALIVGQMRRVIPKQKGNTHEWFRDHVMKVTFDAVHAWASTRGRSELDTRLYLSTLINNQCGKTLTLADADILADAVIGDRYV